jgi:hypothetical protein
VHPRRWKVELNACASKGGAESNGKPLPVTLYHWTLDRDQSGFPTLRIPTLAVSTKCRVAVNVKRLGRWHVTLTVTNARGEQHTQKRTVTLQDKVVVSLGDSYSAGEGNPDVLRSVVFDPGSHTTTVTPEEWASRQCHRSQSGWPARVARSLEHGASPHVDTTTTVTFLSFACSGAKTYHLWHRTYEDQDPDGQRPLPPRSTRSRASSAQSAAWTRCCSAPASTISASAT